MKNVGKIITAMNSEKSTVECHFAKYHHSRSYGKVKNVIYNYVLNV